MGVFTRLSDIINSNIVAILDRAEDPEKMLRLIISEMEETLVEVKSSAAKIIGDKKTLERHINELSEEEKHWQERAELAIERNRDDLAKSALEEKHKRTEARETLTGDLATVEENLKKFQDDIRKLELKLDETQKKRKTLLARRQTALSQIEIRKKLQMASSTGAFAKFEQLQRNVERFEGDVIANELREKTPLENEFTKLENNTKIDEELNELKRSKGKPVTKIEKKEDHLATSAEKAPKAVDNAKEGKGKN